MTGILASMQQLSNAADDAARQGLSFDLAGGALEFELPWAAAIKVVRKVKSCSIYDAQHTLLQHRAWNKLAGKRLLNDQKCRREALAHVNMARNQGRVPLVERNGDQYTIAVEPTR